MYKLFNSTKYINNIFGVSMQTSSFTRLFAQASQAKTKRSGLISLSNVALSHDKLLFDNVHLQINHGEHIVLLGRNGAGKSSLADLIAGTIEPDSGSIKRQSNLRIAYVRQIQEQEMLEKQIATAQDILAEFENEQAQKNNKAKGAASVGRIFKSLKLTNEHFHSPLESLSIGEQRRMVLAGAVLSNPDLLILDEPTNHLDQAGVNWLKSCLRGFRNGLILITHDRDLMNSAGNKLFEIDSIKQTVASFRGSYKDLIASKLQQHSGQMKKEKYDALQIKRKKHELDKMNRKQIKTGKGNTYVDVKKIKKIRKDILEMQEEQYKADEFPVEGVANFTFQQTSKAKQSFFIAINDLVLPYAKGERRQAFSGGVSLGERVVITGNNGVGKSIFMQVLAGLRSANSGSANSGSVNLARDVNYGYLPQNTEELSGYRTVREYLDTAQVDFEQSRLYSVLTQMNFQHSDLSKSPDEFSIGQQRRIQFMRIILSEPEILLLDEPTNYFDVFTIEALEQALLNFNGAIVAISHDEWFIKKIASKIWRLEEEQIHEKNLRLNSERVLQSR